MPNDLLQPRPRAIMKEGRNRGEKERVNRKKKKKAGKRADWLAHEPQLETWLAFALFLSILLEGKLS